MCSSDLDEAPRQHISILAEPILAEFEELWYWRSHGELVERSWISTLNCLVPLRQTDTRGHRRSAPGLAAACPRGPGHRHRSARAPPQGGSGCNHWKCQQCKCVGSHGYCSGPGGARFLQPWRHTRRDVTSAAVFGSRFGISLCRGLNCMFLVWRGNMHMLQIPRNSLAQAALQTTASASVSPCSRGPNAC